MDAKTKIKFEPVGGFEVLPGANVEIFDGVYWRHSSIPEDKRVGFKYMTLTKPEWVYRSEELQTDSWLIFLLEDMFEPTAQVTLFKAILGDPKRFVDNQVKAGSDGLVVRECASGYEMLYKILQLTPALEDMRNRVTAHYVLFLKRKIEALK